MYSNSGFHPNRREFIVSSTCAASGLNRSFTTLSWKDDSWATDLIQFGLNLLDTKRISYGDIRISSNRERTYRGSPGFMQSVSMAISVRVLIDGYWGFSSSPVCTEQEVVRLVENSVSIATHNAMGPQRYVDLGGPVTSGYGKWQTPVRIDPFSVHPDEINDFLDSLRLMMLRYRGVVDIPVLVASFNENQMWFGSTENLILDQRQIISGGEVQFKYRNDKRSMTGMIETLSDSSMGWEHFIDQPLQEVFERELEDVKFDIALPIKPIDVGRFDMVFDSASIGHLVAETIGKATILSRIAGYNANDSGTSFIIDPIESRDRLSVASPLLNVVSDRSQETASQTVKWDAEGVSPVDVNLITNGLISDYTTSREMEGWLRSISESIGSPRVSTGSTTAASATDLPQATMGNITVKPGSQDIGTFDLISQMGNGIAMKRMGLDVDYQCLNGVSRGGLCYEVKQGERKGVFQNGSVMFRTPEFLKNISAIGGSKSLRRFANISSAPMLVEDCTVTDVMRRA